MATPTPDDPDFCPGSGEPAADFHPDVLWHRCPRCGRLIGCGRRSGRFYKHLSNRKRARKGDAIQESLTAYGFNRRSA